MLTKQVLTVFGIVTVMATAGCASDAGNAALGAAAVGAAYETANEREQDQLEQQRDEGKISQDEFNRRNEDIKDRSIVK